MNIEYNKSLFVDSPENLDSFDAYFDNLEPDILPNNIGKYCEEIARKQNQPLGACVFTALSVISAVVGNRATYKAPSFDWNGGCNVNVFIVGKSGSGKSPLFKSMFYPFEKIQSVYTKQSAEFRRQIENDNPDFTDEQIQKAIKRKRIPNLTPSDVTTEGLVDIVANNEESGVFEGTLLNTDEGAGLLDLGAYKNGAGKKREIASYTKLLDGGSYSYYRKGTGGKSLEKVCLSMFAGIQTETLAEQINKNAALVSQGFCGRFLWAYLPRKQSIKPNLEPINALAKRSYESIFEKIQTIQESYEYELDNEAEAVLGAYIDEIDEKKAFIEQSGALDDFMDAIWTKSTYNALHIALIIHFAKWAQDVDSSQARPKRVIGADTIERAVKIARFACESAEQTKNRLVDVVNKKSTIGKTFATLEKAVLEGMFKRQQGDPDKWLKLSEFRDCANNFKKLGTQAQKNFLENLGKRGLIEINEQPYRNFSVKITYRLKPHRLDNDEQENDIDIEYINMYTGKRYSAQ